MEMGAPADCGQGVPDGLHQVLHLRRIGDPDGVRQRHLADACVHESAGDIEDLCGAYAPFVGAAEGDADAGVDLHPGGLTQPAHFGDLVERLGNAAVQVALVVAFGGRHRDRHVAHARFDRSLHALHVGYKHPQLIKPVVECLQDRLGIGELRHPLWVHHRGGLYPHESALKEVVDQSDLGRGRQGRGPALEAIPWPDLDPLDTGRAGHRPVKCASRFSKNALTPSLRSSLSPSNASWFSR